MKLSILICTLEKRKSMLDSLLKELEKQITGKEGIEVLISHEEDLKVGEKRNSLLDRAKGKYSMFIDDDDKICSNYIDLILEAIKKGPDCCSLKGIITTNGSDARTFIHSIRYDSYFEKDGIYYRPPNHLNVIKTSIAKKFKFPEKNFGEDTDWAMQICRSKMLKKEVWIDPILYYYKFISNK